MINFPTIEEFIGNTPLVKMQRMLDIGSNTLLFKLEGNNPAGSVKDRAALSMIEGIISRGELKQGQMLIEATSGNTGIALAMVCAIKNIKLCLVIPENSSKERMATMRAYGAEVITVSSALGMEGARDLAEQLAEQGKGIVLDQFANKDNPRAHYRGTAQEIYSATGGKITHFVSAMGTTGTIVGVGEYLKSQNKAIQIIGVQPAEGANIAGIRKWPAAYVPKIYRAANIDKIVTVSQQAAEQTARLLAEKEGIFCGISSGGAVAAACELIQSQQLQQQLIVCIICDRGDRYLSTGVFG